jgi:hypothetical protein
MSEIDKVLSKYNDECTQTIQDACNRVDTVIEESVSHFSDKVYDDIPKQFGEFLATALGDRINGQRSSVVNKTFFEVNADGKALAIQAEKANQTIEEYIQEQVKKGTYNTYYGRKDINLYLSVGRYFGVSYYAGQGNRVSTKYFHPTKSFKYLTQEHCDCIKNKRKRECAQGFLDFKLQFMEDYKNIEQAVTIETDVPIKSAKILAINVCNKYNRYSDRAEHYRTIDNMVDKNITHIRFSTPAIEVWDMASDIDTDCKSKSRSCESYVGANFVRIDQNKNEFREVASVLIEASSFRHTLKSAIEGDDSIASYGDHGLRHDYAFQNKYGHGTQRLRLQDENTLIMNLDEIIVLPEVKAELDKRIGFYARQSKALQELKENFADLFFVNSESI